MLSLPGAEDTTITNNNTTKNTKCFSRSASSSSSSSFSSSSSSSPSTFSPSVHITKNNNIQVQHPQSMEEVWKEINLASLHDHPSGDQDLSVITPRSLHHPQHSHHHPNFILQDFLARPFNKDPPSSRIVSSRGDTSLYGSPVPHPPPPPPPPPPTVLSLNSGLAGFDFLDSPDRRPPPPARYSHFQNPPIPNLGSPFNSPFEALDHSSPGLPSFGKRRVQESDNNSGGDRRHKRMIKNRESAARSRARKQAYTNELELEVAHLLEENARLRRLQEQLCVAAASSLPKKHSIHRASTAPF